MKYLFSLLFIAAFTTATLAQKTVNVSEFTEVYLKTSADVYISKGSTLRVEVEGDEDDLEDVDIYVKGGTLYIDSEDSWSWFGSSSSDVTVNITMPTIEGASVSGSGSLVGKDKFRTNELSLAVSGSGIIELNADAGYTSTAVSGSGKIYLSGSAEEMSVKISGSGRVKAEDFVSEKCKVSISGSGSAQVNVKSSIDARISGSGSVYYKGDPAKVDSHTSGSGRIRKM
ncbi:DUF2807 domain-containing protein [Fulvivirga sp. RKSG066]|uniref:head GIN domain-containing protein n=1 Tax=Fulvivirga aurantia TaxID=2529383 RepID=UPI0012BBA213|nr:head GIN domain-containing protein [Fulvivirga aurantia]MTI22191.1 DUF2807 domain-containing protein [Fulvivirga aurantia]